MNKKRDLLLIYTAAFLRASGVGMMGVVLGIYLSHAGFSATLIGFVVAAGMAGIAFSTLVVSFQADRLGRRLTLVALSLLTSLSAFGLALFTNFSVVLLLAFAGILNGMGRDRGASYALEQAMASAATTEDRRTWALAWYNVVLDAGHALGALAGGFPFVFRTWLDVELLTSYSLTFGLHAFLSLAGAILYLLLSTHVEVVKAELPLSKSAPRISPGSKKIVLKLAALAGMDSLGGGFLSATLVSYWFFRRFGAGEESLAPLFFVIRILNAASYLVAARLAQRIGLLNTMVFTHIPSSLFLLVIPFVFSFEWAVGLLIARECLVEMDVPTRQSYLVAVVQPSERTFASGITTLTRNFSYAAGPSLAGYLMQYLTLAAPLYLGGTIKIIYDVLLYVAFRRIKPPEEL